MKEVNKIHEVEFELDENKDVSMEYVFPIFLFHFQEIFSIEKWFTYQYNHILIELECLIDPLENVIEIWKRFQSFTKALLFK